MVKVPSISWWRRFCSVRGRSLGCTRRGKPLPNPPPPPLFFRIDLGGESRFGEAFLLDESPPPDTLPLLPSLPSLWWWRPLCEPWDRHEEIFDRPPSREDLETGTGTLGIGEVPAVPAVGESWPSSLRAPEEEEEKDFRTMRFQVSRIAMLGYSGEVRVYVCVSVTTICSNFGFGVLTRALRGGKCGLVCVVDAGMKIRGTVGSSVEGEAFVRVQPLSESRRGVMGSLRGIRILFVLGG